MKKVLCSILLLTVFGNFSFAQKTINDPYVEKITVTDFHGIVVSSAFDVYLSQGNEDGLAVSASEQRYRERIKTEVKNGILYIGYDEKGFHFNSGRMKLKAYISFKNLSQVKANGACNLYVIGDMKANELEISLSGASDLKGMNLKLNKLSVSLSGASDMKISGSVPQLIVQAGGASDFKAYDLITDYCDVGVSGASSVQITVNKELSVKATGASDVRYKGDGVIRDLKASGSSSVSKKS